MTAPDRAKIADALEHARRFKDDQYLIDGETLRQASTLLRTPTPTSAEVAGMVERLRNCVGGAGEIMDEAADLLTLLSAASTPSEEIRDAISECVAGRPYADLYRDKQAWLADRGARGDVNGPFQVDVDAAVERIAHHTHTPDRVGGRG